MLYGDLSLNWDRLIAGLRNPSLREGKTQGRSWLITFCKIME